MKQPNKDVTDHFLMWCLYTGIITKGASDHHNMQKLKEIQQTIEWGLQLVQLMDPKSKDKLLTHANNWVNDIVDSLRVRDSTAKASWSDEVH